mgnify:CR=1 FL=1
MTRSIEEALGLPPIEKPSDEPMKIMPEYLPVTDGGEKELVEEMNEVIKTALDSYKTIMDFSYNVEPKHAGSIMAQATAHLDIVVKASKNKSDIRARLIKLQQDRDLLEKRLGIEQQDGEVVETSKGEVWNRNDLMRELKQNFIDADFEDNNDDKDNDKEK